MRPLPLFSFAAKTTNFSELLYLMTLDVSSSLPGLANSTATEPDIRYWAKRRFLSLKAVTLSVHTAKRSPDGATSIAKMNVRPPLGSLTLTSDLR